MAHRLKTALAALGITLAVAVVACAAAPDDSTSDGSNPAPMPTADDPASSATPPTSGTSTSPGPAVAATVQDGGATAPTCSGDTTHETSQTPNALPGLDDCNGSAGTPVTLSLPIEVLGGGAAPAVWYHYAGTTSFCLGSDTPGATLTGGSIGTSARVCVFVKRADGSPTSGCATGAASGDLPGYDGCCATGSATGDGGAGASAKFTDYGSFLGGVSADVFIRVDRADANPVCDTGLTLAYAYSF